VRDDARHIYYLYDYLQRVRAAKCPSASVRTTTAVRIRCAARAICAVRRQHSHVSDACTGHVYTVYVQCAVPPATKQSARASMVSVVSVSRATCKRTCAVPLAARSRRQTVSSTNTHGHSIYTVRCANGNDPVGSCLNSQCGAGFSCEITTNLCCPSGGSPSFG
jgi:hypothetical protein